MEYIERDYRHLHRQDDLIHFQVVVKETDLDIGVRKDSFSPELMAWVHSLVKECRSPLEQYIKRDPVFVKALSPYELLPNAPPIAVDMARAGYQAGVGPMAAVAGTVSQWVGQAIAKRTRDVIVENGGDIFLRTGKIRYIGIFAGESPLSNRIALEVRPEHTPLGICTSSGTVGHSLSYGKADAVIVLSPSAALADAVATAAGNLVQTVDDLESALEFALGVEGVTGALVIKDDRLAVRGYVKLLPVK